MSIKAKDTPLRLLSILDNFEDINSILFVAESNSVSKPSSCNFSTISEVSVLLLKYTTEIAATTKLRICVSVSEG